MSETSLRKRKIVVASSGLGAIAFCDRFKCEFAEIVLLGNSDLYAPYSAIGRIASQRWSKEAGCISLQERYAKRPDVSVVRDTIKRIHPESKTLELANSEATIQYDFLVVGENDPGLPSKNDPGLIELSLKNRTDRTKSIHIHGLATHGLEIAVGLGKIQRVFYRFPGKNAFPELEKEPAQKLGFEIRRAGVFLQSLDAKKSDEDLDAVAISYHAKRIPEALMHLEGSLNARGSLSIRPDFQLRSFPKIFALSEIADAKDGVGKPLRETPSVWIQQGRYMARILKGKIEGVKAYQNDSPSFNYRDYGEFAHLGFGKSIGVWKKHRYKWFALLVDAFAHKLPEYIHLWGAGRGFIKWLRYYSE